MGGSEIRGWIVAEISLKELWRTVIRPEGRRRTGYALLLDEHFKLLAHGNPNDKAKIASGDEAAPEERALAEALRAERPSTEPKQFSNDRGEKLLAVAAAVESPRWAVLVEQPTMDAFAVAVALKRQLLAAIGLALLGTVILGWLWARSFIQRIFALTRVTRAIADGRMDERVELSRTRRNPAPAILTRSTCRPIESERFLAVV